MSRLISDILNAPEPHFSHAVKQWEHLSGNSGHDIRLLSDIAQARRQALRELRLDEHDTTPRELFFALRHRATVTNAELQAELKITDGNSPEEAVAKIVAFVESLPLQREVWTVKHTVIKRLLKKQCPKKLLKVLGLRSIDSVIKRMSAYELLALAYEVEPADWVNKMHNRFKQLKPSDFQVITSTIFVAGKPQTEKLRKGGYKGSKIIVPNFETGSILVIPPRQRFKLDVLAITLALLEMLHELRIYSAYFRHISVKADFGNAFAGSVQSGLPGSNTRTQIGWRTLQKHFNRAPALFAAIEQPHLQYEDVTVVPPGQVLAELLPDFAFWNEYRYVFMPDKTQPVSFHLLDVVTAASNNQGHSGYGYMQDHLWEELGLRYLQHASVQAVIVEAIDNS